MSRFSVLIITLLTLLSLSPNPTFSISLHFPNPNSPSKTLVAADAHFTGGGDADAAVQLNYPTPSSYGVILPNTAPFIFNSSTSLSSHFTFQIGNNLALVIIPSKFATNMSFKVLDANRLLGIEFYANVCTILSSRVSNVSKISNVLEGGVKLSSWIDYRAILKRLDVRVSRLGDPKPVEPLISYRVDLGEILKGEEVLLGLVSFNEKYAEEEVTFVYSWSLEVKDFPKWVHSIPVNPEGFSSVRDSKKEGGLVSGFVLATGCGALAALVMLFVWSYVVDRRKVEGDDCAHAGEFKYEKIDVLEGKNVAGRK
ncbi:putative non-specific serine/threonine protein kinase [Helianthus annuus]|nr:putative non-specific serine/threonine protein kinase [Helianthus annuus]KAJ0661570.1 putative non-specific serine/threonine protein kinase [Helianthus annuus]KAJ0855782.1 putative non-specific serine/threonine protein kinase [Helianthus annuus]